MTSWVATQHPHLVRDLVAKYTGLDKAEIRVVAPHVGGAFGGKAGISSGHAAIVAARPALDRPVAWTETRSEAMLSMQGRGQVQFAELGLTRDGRIAGLRARGDGRLRRLRGLRRRLAVGSTRTMAQGPYGIPQHPGGTGRARDQHRPDGAFRGAGRPEAAAMLERLLDLAADELELAPEEIRRRNLSRPTSSPTRRRRE